LLLLGVLPLLAVGGAGLFALMNLPKPAPAPTSSSGLGAPDLEAAANRLQDSSAAMFKAIQSALSDVSGLVAKPSEADFQSFLTAHPGTTAIYQLGADGKPSKLVPTGSTVVDASFSATEDFQNIQKRATDPNGKWPYLFYSRRGLPSFVFVQRVATGGFVGAVLDIGYFFKNPAFAQGESYLVEAGSGQILFDTTPGKVGTLFSTPGDSWRESVLQDLKNKVPGTKVTAQAAAVFSPLGIATFGLVQTIPMVSASAPPKAAAVEGLTLEKILKDPSELLQNPIVLVLLGMLGWVLLVGFLLRSWFLKPIYAAQKLLESVVSGNAKVSEEALRKVGAPEVQALVRVSTQWADRLEREKEDLSRRREEDSQRTNGQLQQRGQELADAVQKLGNLKSETEQKDQQLTAKVQELEALRGMGEGLRNQAEQARGEIAKLKTQMSNQESEAKQRETTLHQQFDQQANQAAEQLKELESKLLQIVAAAGSITVSRVRVAAIKTMAEELKTTLGIIKGYVSSALGSAQGGITEKQQEFLGMVINRSARLEKFINDLVDIYQVEIDQETAPREEVALASEIEGMAFNFQPQADIKSIKIRVEEKGGPLPKVPIVRRRFTQLWNILYLQIIKDSPRGSLVPVTIERVGEDIKVTLVDPGLTVKPEHLPRLFDEFYDPKHPASTQLAGTGLKFALVKTILNAHGGGAMAEKAEVGTRLILTFPIKVKPKENPAAALLASVKLPSASVPQTGGLLGAVKPGTVVSSAPASPIAVAPAPKPMAPGPNPTVLKPTAPSAGMSGGLDALLSGKVAPPPPSAAPKPTAAPAMPGLPPVAPKMAMPSMPGMSGPPSAPSVPRSLAPPPAGLGSSLGAPPVAPKPAESMVPPAPSAPVIPASPAASAPGAKAPMDFEALFSGKAAPSVPPPPPLSAPKPLAPPMSAPAGLVPPQLKPPSAPGIPNIPRPVPPPPPGAPPMSASPKIVPTTIKPTAPPPGILDLENQDGMKTEESSAPPPKAAPPAPPASGAGKPIVKDLDKENGDDAGELIE
jgi:signal transduction histidine kinase